MGLGTRVEVPVIATRGQAPFAFHYYLESPHHVLCSVCQEVEDEIHFLIRCTRYNSLRNEFFGKIYQISPNFTSLNDNEKYVFLMTSCNKQLMVWLGKFVHEIFGYRGEQLSLRNRSS